MPISHPRHASISATATTGKAGVSLLTALTPYLSTTALSFQRARIVNGRFASSAAILYVVVVVDCSRWRSVDVLISHPSTTHDPSASQLQLLNFPSTANLEQLPTTPLNHDQRHACSASCALSRSLLSVVSTFCPEHGQWIAGECGEQDGHCIAKLITTHLLGPPLSNHAADS